MTRKFTLLFHSDKMNRLSSNVFVQLPTIFTGLSNSTPKRWAGHAKWQNIKSTKEAQDRQRSLNFQRVRQKIILALKDGDNPSTNIKLKYAIEEAKKLMMPKESIQNIIKSSANKEFCDPYWVFYGDFKGIILGFELAALKSQHALSTISQYLKRIQFKHEKNVNDFLNIKGLIISEPLQDTQNSYDKAIEDGIEAGISEVTQDENNTIYFECDPEFIQGSSKKLASMGYNIQSATTEIEFLKFVKVTSNEKAVIDNGIKKLQDNFHDIIRMVNNIEEEQK